MSNDFFMQSQSILIEWIAMITLYFLYHEVAKIKAMYIFIGQQTLTSTLQTQRNLIR